MITRFFLFGTNVIEPLTSFFEDSSPAGPAARVQGGYVRLVQSILPVAIRSERPPPRRSGWSARGGWGAPVTSGRVGFTAASQAEA